VTEQQVKEANLIYRIASDVAEQTKGVMFTELVTHLGRALRQVEFLTNEVKFQKARASSLMTGDTTLAHRTLEFYGNPHNWHRAKIYEGCPDGNRGEWGEGQGIHIITTKQRGFQHPCQLADTALVELKWERSYVEKESENR